MSLELRVYNPTNNTYLGSLNGAYSRAMVEGLNDSGTGQFSISLNDPNIGLVQPRNVVRWRLDGVDVFTSVIDDRPRVILDSNEDPAMRVVGPSIFGWLGSNKGGALVYPEVWKRGLPGISSLRYPYADRHFGWASSEYNASGWTDPVSRGQQGSPEIEFPSLVGAPNDWTDGSAEWIWTVPLLDIRATGDVVGMARFRRVLPKGGYIGPARISIAGQNTWVLYFDGIQVASGGGFTATTHVNVNFTDKDTVVAVEAQNTSGFGFLIMSIRRIDNGNVGNVIYRTFTSTYMDSWAGKEWKCLAPNSGTPSELWKSSAAYDDGWWTVPASRGRQNDPMMILPAAREEPSDWPDHRSEWLWSRPLTISNGRYYDAEGVAYFRRILTGNHAGPARITIAGTNEWELYFDGQPIGSGGGFRNVRSFDVRFHSEATVVGVKVAKIATPSFGRDPGQFILHIARLDQDGNPAGTLYRTFTPAVFGAGTMDWRALDYPTEAPGITPGQLVKTLIDEAKQRGAIPSITYDFTTTLDSNGQPWDMLINRSYKIGTKLSYAIEQLAEYGIDFAITATGVLRLFKKRGVTQLGGFGNLVGHSISGEGPKATTMLARSASGFSERNKTGATERIEDFVEFGDIDDSSSVSILTDNLLKKISVERNETELILSDSSPKPYVDFNVGDTFSIGRITQVALTQEDGNGALEWAVSVTPEN